MCHVDFLMIFNFTAFKKTCQVNKQSRNSLPQRLDIFSANCKLLIYTDHTRVRKHFSNQIVEVTLTVKGYRKLRTKIIRHHNIIKISARVNSNKWNYNFKFLITEKYKPFHYQTTSIKYQTFCFQFTLISKTIQTLRRLLKFISRFYFLSNVKRFWLQS